MNSTHIIAKCYKLIKKNVSRKHWLLTIYEGDFEEDLVSIRLNKGFFTTCKILESLPGSSFAIFCGESFLQDRMGLGDKD